MDSSLTPNFRSIAILCLRSDHDPQATETARTLLSNPSFDWPGFTQFIHRERISPLLHYALGCQDFLPLTFASSIHRVYLENAWTNGQRLDELARLLPVFEAAKIPVVLLKGAALMIAQYEKMALRPMGDMDLLVLCEDFDRAKQVLGSKGYTPEVGITAWMSSDLVTEAHFQKEGQCNLRIDLHSSLFTPPNALTSEEIEWFWKQTVTIEKKGLKIRVFNPEAQVLHLCVHLLYHDISINDGNLLRLNDIANLIRSCQIDWEEVVRTGKSFDLLIPLQKVLQELAANWNSAIPAVAFDKLSQMQPSRQEKHKYKIITSLDRNYSQALSISIMSFPDWYSRMRFAWWIVFPPSQYIKDRYKVHSWFLLSFYYLYRLLNRACH